MQAIFLLRGKFDKIEWMGRVGRVVYGVGLGPKNRRLMYCVYVIQSQINKHLYKGYSDNIKKRIREHNNGRVRATKSFRPWKLIYFECFFDKTDALREELFLKSGKGKERLTYLLRTTMERCGSGLSGQS